MTSSIFIFPKNIVEELPNEQNFLDYDYQLYKLSFNFDNDEFLIINPLFDYNELPELKTESCEETKITVWKNYSNWIAKYFTKHWIPSRFSYDEIHIDIVNEQIWKINPDLNQDMKFTGNIYQEYLVNNWDRKYKLIWYLDPKVNPLKEKIWAFSCEPKNGNIEGEKHMGYVMPDIDVIFNKHIPNKDIDVNNYYPPFWELEYENVYYLDPIFQAEPNTWYVKYSPKYKKNKQWRSKGFISPTIKIEYNPVLGDLNYDLDYQIPWYDLHYEHVWLLDRKHMREGEEDIWAFKISYTNNPKGTKIVDYISPSTEIEYNPILPKLNYTIDHTVYWHDINFTHMWLLDRKHMHEGEEDIWAFKISYTNYSKEVSVIDYISPDISIEYNRDLYNIEKNVDYTIPWYELGYEHIFTLEDSTLKDEVWVTKFLATEETQGKKYVGKLKPILNNLDVIFISYNEPNADKNWNRVLEKAPWAKRVNGVSGVFNAHKAAAKLSSTDMFYVVDGDAYLLDEWNFDFQPGIFDRDCAYVWSSKNPVNDLVYGYGGVKLFSKKILSSKRTWKTLDMFTGIMPKIKVESKISCITEFNVDEFSTWRSAFRECVKLHIAKKIEILNVWLSKGKNRKFGKYSMQGAHDAIQFAEEYKNNHNMLLKINDYEWLKNKFKNKHE